jgi:hypothetical protein
VAVGFLLSLAALIVSVALLHRTIRAFIAGWREAEIARGPAVPMQSLHVPAAGPLALFLDGPRYATYTKRLHFAMRDPETGQSVPVQPVLMGSGVRSLRRSRVQRGRFVLSRPGRFELRIDGLHPDDARDYSIVIMRQVTGMVIRFVLTCVVLGLVLIGSLVLGILSLVF